MLCITGVFSDKLQIYEYYYLYLSILRHKFVLKSNELVRGLVKSVVNRIFFHQKMFLKFRTSFFIKCCMIKLENE